MAMGTEARIGREIEDEFHRRQTAGEIPEDVRLEVRFEESEDPCFRRQGVAYNAVTGYRITQIALKLFELRRPVVKANS